MTILEQKYRCLACIVIEIREASCIIIVGEDRGIGPVSIFGILVGNVAPRSLVLGVPGAGIYRPAVVSGIGKSFRKILEDFLRVFFELFQNLGELLAERSLGILVEGFPDGLVKEGVNVVEVQEQ